MRSCSRSAADVCATVRAGFAAGLEWARGLETADIAAAGKGQRAHSRTGAAKTRRLLLLSRRPKRRFTVVICLCPAG